MKLKSMLPTKPLPNRCPCGCGCYAVKGAKVQESFWNYRIARHLPEFKSLIYKESETCWYGIHEVYYEIHGENLVILSLSTESTRLIGDSSIDFKNGFMLMQKAFDRDVLIVDHKCRVIGEEPEDFTAKTVK